jgi:phenylacetate-CoA ligase
VKQDLRDAEAEAPPWGTYRFTDPRQAVRVGQSTGTTGSPTISIWTRRDLWIEYESSARVWWRYGYRPGMIVTHAHPAYLYGGGPMLSGSYEYFGMLNVWVPPPDTDELAEQGLRFWTRVKPDIPFMGFSTGRFFEVAAKVGINPKDAGLEFKGMPGFGMGKGMPLMTAGAECFAYVGGACGQMPGAHINEDWGIVQAVDPATGAEVADGEWGDLVVTTLDRDNGLLRYDLEEACAILREPCSCGETSVRGLWGGRFKDLIALQGTRFQANEVESALRGVGEVNEPTLEWQMVRPTDETRPLVVRVERGTGAGGDDADIAKRCAGVIRDALGIDADVIVLAREAIPRSGYKAGRVVDE